MQDIAIGSGAQTAGRPAPAPLRALLRWWRERRTAGALQELDDAALKDIGVHRCEIPAVARARCAGRPEWR